MTCSLLIVEDDAEFRALVVRRFERRGYHVVACGCLESAKSAVQLSHFDAVLMDRTIGRQDSLSFIPELKELHPEIPIVILSGYDDRVSIEAALAMGVVEYLIKPCSLADVELAIQHACGATVL